MANDTTGMHVHVDASDLTLAQLRNLSLNFMKFESALDLITHPTRRGVSNSYVMSNRAAHGALSNKQVERQVQPRMRVS